MPCTRLYNSRVIAANGDVPMCCMDYNVTEKLGNIWQDGYDLWNHSSTLTKLREMHEAGEWNKIPACRDCTVYAYNHSKEWINYWIKKKSFVASAINR